MIREIRDETGWPAFIFFALLLLACLFVITAGVVELFSGDDDPSFIGKWQEVDSPPDSGYARCWVLLSGWRVMGPICR